jgi:hypothetical protein
VTAPRTRRRLEGFASRPSGSPAPLPRDRPRTRKAILVIQRTGSYNRCDKVRKDLAHEVNYYAHTAVNADGTPDLVTTAKWQLLSAHLRRVASLARDFAQPLRLEAEANLAGGLHDFGKYQGNFQSYLKHGRPRTPHAALGAALVRSRSDRLANVIAGHHAGLDVLGLVGP